MNTSRERMVQATAELLRLQGYHATGLNQIIAHSRAPKGSLYYYFPGGKEDLVANAIDFAGQQVFERVRSLFEAAPSASEAVRSLFDVHIEELETSNFEKGCPVATVTLEAAPVSDRIHGSVSQAFTVMLEYLTAKLEEFGHTPEEARSLGILVFSAFEGAIMISKGLRDTGPLRQVRDRFVRLLEQGS